MARRDAGAVTTGVVLTRWESDHSVHETAVRAVEGAAASAVRGYVGYEEWPSVPMTRRELARNGLALILAFGDPLEVHDRTGGPARSLGAFAIGNQSHASLTRLGGYQLGVQVELTIAGAIALFGQVGELNDEAVPLDEVLGSWGRQLVEQLGNAASWEDRFALLDRAFAARQAGRAERCRLAPEVAWLMHQLKATGGQARVEPLMDETGWSRRLVTAHFRNQVGVSPKAYARVLRFNRAVALLKGSRPGRTLADVAIECGYYDQSHFNRDFMALAGCSPSVYLAEVQDDPGVRFVQDDHLPPSLR
jgi:AraC-like DNA-binding protein